MDRKLPTSLNFIERKLLLQLFWEFEASINQEFKKNFEDTARDISTEMITFEAWPKYVLLDPTFQIIGILYIWSINTVLLLYLQIYEEDQRLFNITIHTCKRSYDIL
jgi:hypothetical protein